MKNKSLFLFISFLFNVLFVSAQEITVKGIVIDTNDYNSLMGCRVSIKGTSNSVLTDIDGKYSIKAFIGDTIRYDYFSLVSEEQIVDADNIDAYLLPHIQFSNNTYPYRNSNESRLNLDVINNNGKVITKTTIRHHRKFGNEPNVITVIYEYKTSGSNKKTLFDNKNPTLIDVKVGDILEFSHPEYKTRKLIIESIEAIDSSADVEKVTLFSPENSFRTSIDLYFNEKNKKKNKSLPIILEHK